MDIKPLTQIIDRARTKNGVATKVSRAALSADIVDLFSTVDTTEDVQPTPWNLVAEEFSMPGSSAAKSGTVTGSEGFFDSMYRHHPVGGLLVCARLRTLPLVVRKNLSPYPSRVCAECARNTRLRGVFVALTHPPVLRYSRLFTRA